MSQSEISSIGGSGGLDRDLLESLLDELDSELAFLDLFPDREDFTLFGVIDLDLLGEFDLDLSGEFDLDLAGEFD